MLKNHKILGVVFLCLLLAAAYFTYAIFTKQFARYDEVTLMSSKIGLQLPQRADVKIRGVHVGEVLEVEASGKDRAEITLGMYPDAIESVPSEVTGSILPKTLFGEKYVSLDVPDGVDVPTSAEQALQAGDTIKRSAVSIEVEKVLSDLYPLLRAVQPAELNYTLNALATALEGRGDDLGENLETLDSYLKRMNPQIPALVEDLRLTASVSDLYADVLPEVGQTLRNTIVTAQTLETRDAKLRRMFSDVAAFGDTTRVFLEANGDNIIRLADLSVPQLRLLAKYAPEYPCLLGGIVGAGRTQAEAFRGFTLHINLELLPNQPRGYTADDVPRLGDKRGPHCGSLPNPPWSQSNVFKAQPDFDDGVDEGTGKGTRRVAPDYSPTSRTPGSGYVGSPQETALLNALIAPSLGEAPDELDPMGALLVGPMVRGQEVSLR